jgi:hypothetical protein
MALAAVCLGSTLMHRRMFCTLTELLERCDTMHSPGRCSLMSPKVLAAVNEAAVGTRYALQRAYLIRC